MRLFHYYLSVCLYWIATPRQIPKSDRCFGTRVRLRPLISGLRIQYTLCLYDASISFISFQTFKIKLRKISNFISRQNWILPWQTNLFANTKLQNAQTGVITNKTITMQRNVHFYGIPYWFHSLWDWKFIHDSEISSISFKYPISFPCLKWIGIWDFDCRTKESINIVTAQLPVHGDYIRKITCSPEHTAW